MMAYSHPNVNDGISKSTQLKLGEFPRSNVHTVLIRIQKGPDGPHEYITRTRKIYHITQPFACVCYSNSALRYNGSQIIPHRNGCVVYWLCAYFATYPEKRRHNAPR